MDDNIIDGLHDAGCSEELIELYGSAASDCAHLPAKTTSPRVAR
jgi:hypothetical protein